MMNRTETERSSGSGPASESHSKLHVLFVTPRYYPDMGGIETHVYEVARRLVDRTASITVITTDPGGKLEPESVVDGVRIVRVKAYPANRDYYFAPGLGQQIKAGRWDVMHVQGYHTLVPPLAMRAARQANIPYVLTFHSGGHSSGLRQAIRPWQARLQRGLLANARRLIGVSRFEAEQFRRWLKLPTEQFVVVNNGASLPPIPEDYQPEQSEHEMILSVGRLEKYKGHHRIVEAMPFVLQQRPNARLKVLGLGSYRDDLRELVARMGLQDSVEITHIPPGDRTGMARAMMDAALVTLFSEYEAHPVAVMEAVAMNCSILVADTTGLSEMAEKGLASAIPVTSSAQQIASAIVQQLETPFTPNKVALPTWDSCADDLLALYQTVAKEAAS